MEPSSFVPRGLSPQEVELIEEGTDGAIAELSANGYPELPNEIEVCKMVKMLQGKLNTDVTSLDLALYLRGRPIKDRPAVRSVTTAQPVMSFFKQFADISKVQQPLREKREYICRSKRKIKPTEAVPRRQLQQMVQVCDSNIADCNILFQRKNRRTSGVQVQSTLHEKCQWVYHQYFYSFFDRTYLKDQEPFARLQQALRINPEAVTYYDAKVLRSALPKPKLFNSQFIAAEVERLNDFRNQARAAPKHRGKSEWELSVGRQVVGVHPVCGHLHAGSILAIYKENLYMVKFVRPELGTQKILDVNIALREVAHPHRVVVQSVNFEVMALVIKLLQFKADLISLLSRYNDLAQEVQREQNGLDNRFYQQYGWIGSTINILSLGIRHILSRFRLRGLDSSNQERIGRNFANVLLNPLNLMEKQLDKSSENSDINASQQIKRIISNYKESRVDQYSRQLFFKNWQTLKSGQWSAEQRDQFSILMRSLVGILVSLRVQHKGFSIEQNKYFKELMNHFDSKFPEYINEIYELLASITSRLNEDPK